MNKREIFVQLMFKPSVIGLLMNPFYIARTGLYRNVKKHALKFTGKLIDIGCGDKPYEKMFANVEKYEGLEITTTVHTSTKADYFYDGNSFPFEKESYDSVILNEVLEHVFNPSVLFAEIKRIMKVDGKLLITVPFVWDEHEQPYDFARYSSFGLAHLLKTNGFEIEVAEKSTPNIGVLFQLLNGYLYKISYKWNIVFRIIFLAIFCFPINLLGVVFGFLLPNNFDLYLDNIIIARKATKQIN
jgi:SAM-dependent methyltransferase